MTRIIPLAVFVSTAAGWDSRFPTCVNTTY